MNAGGTRTKTTSTGGHPTLGGLSKLYWTTNNFSFVFSSFWWILALIIMNFFRLGVRLRVTNQRGNSMAFGNGTGSGRASGNGRTVVGFLMLVDFHLRCFGLKTVNYLFFWITMVLVASCYLTLNIMVMVMMMIFGLLVGYVIDHLSIED